MNSVIFDGLSKEEKEEFLSVFEKRSFKAGDIIKKEGQSRKCAFFVTEGEVIIKKGKDETEIGTIKGGEDLFFSVTCLIDGGKSLTTVKAKTDTKTLRITQKKLFDFCQKNPQIGEKVMENIAKLLAKFLRRSDEKIVQMYTTLEEVL